MQALENYEHAYEQLEQDVQSEAPGDIRNEMRKISDDIHRLIVRADKQISDGKDAWQTMQQIENNFIKVSKL